MPLRTPRLEAVGLIEVEELGLIRFTINQHQLAADQLAGFAQNIEGKAEQFRSADSPRFIQREVLSKMCNEVKRRGVGLPVFIQFRETLDQIAVARR